MLTKNKIQFIKNLHEKSGRHEAGLFLVEWRKWIIECIASEYEIVEGFFTEKFFTFLSWVDIASFPGTIAGNLWLDKMEDRSPIREAQGWRTHEEQKVLFPYEIISEKELERISTLSSNRDGLLIVKMLSCSRHSEWNEESRTPGSFVPQDDDTTESKKVWLTLILDGINDPGNLGTIIRIADWYGVSRIIASLDTVDIYNPKTIMATMGSWTRVSVEYRDLEEYFASVISTDTRYEQNGEILPEKKQSKISRLRSAPLEMTETLPKLKIYWAYLEGGSIRTKKFIPTWWYLVIGSESHGIRSNLEKYITEKITIPRIGLAESLNAGVATAVILERMVG